MSKIYNRSITHIFLLRVMFGNDAGRKFARGRKIGTTRGTDAESAGAN